MPNENNNFISINLQRKRFCQIVYELWSHPSKTECISNEMRL